MDGGGRLWTIMGFYAGLRAVCVVAKGLTEFCGEMPCFTAQCQTFDHFFGFCRAVGMVVFRELVGSEFFVAGVSCITRWRIVKSQKKEALQLGCKPLETALRNLFSFGQKSAVYQVGKRVFV